MENKKSILIISIKQFLVDNCGLKKNIDHNELIFSSNKIDSLNILKLVQYIEQLMNIKISPLDVNFKNFDTINKIENFLKLKFSNNYNKF